MVFNKCARGGRLSLIPALGRPRSVDLSEFKASLVYITSSRPAFTVSTHLKKSWEQGLDTVQELSSLVALAKDPGSIPSSHMEARHFLPY